MKFSCSYTDMKGITVSLAVSAPSSFYEPSSGTEEEICLDRSLVSSAFEQSIPELSNQLLQVHAQSELALQRSFVIKLQEKVRCFEDVIPESKEAA